MNLILIWKWILLILQYVSQGIQELGTFYTLHIMLKDEYIYKQLKAIWILRNQKINIS